MENYTSDNLKSVLENVLMRVSDAENDNTFSNYKWYDSLFPKQLGERNLAVHAIEYPELHDLMRNIVKEITSLNRKNDTVWSHSSYMAAGAFARELALAHKDDIMLYAKYISTTDLTHENESPGEDMADIASKWGLCNEIYMLYVARWFTPGQHRDEFGYDDLKEELKENGEAEKLIEMTAKWFSEEWLSPFAISRVDLVFEFFEEVFDDDYHSHAMDLFDKIYYGEDYEEEEEDNSFEIDMNEVDTDAKPNPEDMKVLFEILEQYKKKTLDEEEERIIDDIYANKEFLSHVLIHRTPTIITIQLFRKGIHSVAITLTGTQVIFLDKSFSMITKNMNKELQEHIVSLYYKD